jgi:hypothetical protein
VGDVGGEGVIEGVAEDGGAERDGGGGLSLGGLA